MKAALDTSTNYDKMIENAKKVLQQAERDRNVLEKRVAKQDDEDRADQIRDNIVKYKAEIDELKKKNL
jgi:DNA repair exonuclease SbcCD ATPase subunit